MWRKKKLIPVGRLAQSLNDTKLNWVQRTLSAGADLINLLAVCIFVEGLVFL